MPSFLLATTSAAQPRLLSCLRGSALGHSQRLAPLSVPAPWQALRSRVPRATWRPTALGPLGVIAPQAAFGAAAARAFALHLSRYPRWAVGAAGARFACVATSQQLTKPFCAQPAVCAATPPRHSSARGAHSAHRRLCERCCARRSQGAVERTHAAARDALPPDPYLCRSQSSGFDIHGALEGASTRRSCARPHSARAAQLWALRSAFPG